MEDKMPLVVNNNNEAFIATRFGANVWGIIAMIPASVCTT